MSWFSGIGHALGGAFRGVDQFANKINPMQGTMMSLNKAAGGIPLIGKPLEKLGNWGTTHPAEAAALAATVYYGGGALMGGGGAGGAGGAIEGGTNLFAADAAAYGAGGAGSAAAGGAAAGGAGGGIGSFLSSNAGNIVKGGLLANGLYHSLNPAQHAQQGTGSQLAGANGQFSGAYQQAPNQYNPQMVNPALVGSTQRPYQLPNPTPQNIAGYNSAAGGSQNMAGYNPLAGGYQNWLAQQSGRSTIMPVTRGSGT